MIGKKILIADDDEQVQSFLRRALDKIGCRSLGAADGTLVFDAAMKEKPDLIVLDLNMPGLNGRKVLKILRAHPATQAIPVIILTGEGEIMDKVAGFESGADDYVTKPFTMEELVARMEGLIRRAQRDLSANPITRLPGNPAIEAEVRRRIDAGLGFTFFYVDIDNFKPYNDSYGYARGDQVIQATSDVLQGCASALGPDCFVGHVGGDDFVLVGSAEASVPLAEAVVKAFDERVPSFYSDDDRKKGFIASRNRQGIVERFPLMTLSVAVTSSRNFKGEIHYGHIVKVAAEIKKNLKALKDRKGSAYKIDRRVAAAKGVSDASHSDH